MHQVRARHQASVPVLRQLIIGPERSRKRFAEFLSAYWDSCLAYEWPTLERHLPTDTARRDRYGFHHGMSSMPAGIAPGLHVDQDGDEVVIASPRRPAGTFRLDLPRTGQEQLLLVLSHFVLHFYGLVCDAHGKLMDAMERVLR